MRYQINVQVTEPDGNHAIDQVTSFTEGWDRVCVFMHRSFTGYAEFSRALENGLSDVLAASEAFLIDPKTGEAVNPFHFKYLAQQLE